MPSHRDFRDPVHGFIRLHGRECDVVDTPIFQRLRRIRQLALAHLVYPGAVHTRLEHTLGVVHVAGQMCVRLGVPDDATRIIRLAALVHDVGHGPFSHPSEEVLSKITAHDGRTLDGPKDKIHEVITREIILSDPELGRLISTSDREDIVTLLDTGWREQLFRDIVSGPLDADKQDYLLRDSHHCGVRYGIYDIGRLHEVLTRVDDVSGAFLAIENDGVNTLEQFVLARYYLTTQVITHKIRRITDAMLVRGLWLGVTSDEIDFLARLYRFEPGRDFIDEYARWNDERLMSRLLEPDYASTWAGRFARRLANRDLPKIVFRRAVTEFPELILSSAAVARHSAALEAEVAEIIGASSEEVMFQAHRSPPTRKSEGPVLVRRTSGPPASFEDCSMIFRSVDESLREEHFECYAPLNGLDDRTRKRLLARIDDALVKRIRSIGSTSDGERKDNAG